MKCFFQRWCRKKPENCALYWEGRIDERFIQAMIPVVKMLDKVSLDPTLQIHQDLEKLCKWNPFEKSEKTESSEED